MDNVIKPIIEYQCDTVTRWSVDHQPFPTVNLTMDNGRSFDNQKTKLINQVITVGVSWAGISRLVLSPGGC